VRHRRFDAKPEVGTVSASSRAQALWFCASAQRVNALVCDDEVTDVDYFSPPKEAFRPNQQRRASSR
jgi:hypothetical protein